VSVGRRLATIASNMRDVHPDPEVQPIETRRARALDHLRGDPVLLRRVFLLATGAAVAITIVIAVILTALALTAKADLADRMAEAAAIFAGATLLLAAIAAVVALLAYAVSTGPPDLLLKVEVPESKPNTLAFESIIDPRSQLPAAERLFDWMLFLRNLNGYSANNPAVIVRFHHMGFGRSSWRTSISEEWVAIDTDDEEMIRAIQWDGGPSYSIHGNSVRRLPDIRMTNLWYRGDGIQPMITVEILAEGYKKVRSLPVDFIIEGQSKFPRQDTKVYDEWI
jgi:hypothetical protein